jgi:hypothetical protein
MVGNRLESGRHRFHSERQIFPTWLSGKYGFLGPCHPICHHRVLHKTCGCHLPLPPLPLESHPGPQPEASFRVPRSCVCLSALASWRSVALPLFPSELSVLLSSQLCLSFPSRCLHPRVRGGFLVSARVQQGLRVLASPKEDSLESCGLGWHLSAGLAPGLRAGRGGGYSLWGWKLSLFMGDDRVRPVLPNVELLTPGLECVILVPKANVGGRSMRVHQAPGRKRQPSLKWPLSVIGPVRHAKCHPLGRRQAFACD